jgi:selenide, water dikinase
VSGTPARVGADLVLVGGGHAHVQVLRRWMMSPLPDVRLTVVLDRPEAVYSGMVPGFVAGDYAEDELVIDVVPLARRAGARVVLAAASAVDAAARRIALAGRPPLAYDVASLDVGSTVRGLDLPGVRAHALATRPIGDFVRALDAALARLAGLAAPQVVVIGAGVAGVELAFTLHARLRARGVSPRITVLADGTTIVPGYGARALARVRREAAARAIELSTDTRATAVEPGAVVVGPTRVACDLAVWATGGAPPALVAASSLPHDAEGFVRVGPTLQVEGRDDLFAAGDCAALTHATWVPKAGVYAVRQGPVLDANLRARLRGAPLRPYRPQRDFLSLMNLGARVALGTKWGASVAGRPVWRLKDRIDRRFVRRFQVLAPDGAPAPAFPPPGAMAGAPMQCGGCAAKVEASVLARALGRLPPGPDDASVLVGLAEPDDAATLRLPRGDLLLATVDGFRAFTDDPWLVGRVAAVNAVSDVFAKGGQPRHALALVTVPEDDPRRAEETLYQVLAGVRAALDPLGVALVGGHTTSGPELFVGLTVTGELPGETMPLALDGARPGDALVLTKPLGTGVVLAADGQGRAAGRWVAGALASMLRPNLDAARVARTAAAHAGTDVSGFGLTGHLATLLRASHVGACLHLDALPALDGARTLLAAGIRSTYHAQNARLRSTLTIAPSLAGDPAVDLLFDPQTSGGLLLALAPERAAEAVRALHEHGDQSAAVIGTVEARSASGGDLARVLPTRER